MLQAKVAHGLGLERKKLYNNDDLAIPEEVVESRKYVHYFDDGF